MADSTQEKTEQATQTKLEEASGQGQVPYSKELVAALLFFVVLLALRFTGEAMAAGFHGLLKRAFSLEDYKRVAADGLGSLVEVNTNAYLDIAMPLLATIFVVAALGGFLQIGFTIDPKRLQLRWEKLNPISGMKRLVSLRSVFTVGLSMLKMLVVGSIVYVTLKDLIPRARNIGDSGIDSIVALFTETVFTIGLRVAAVLLFLGLLDLMWQRWRHGKDLMMTKEDVKEDRKRGEGDPRVKGRIRQIQREVARARMMHDVKNASVVIRNPVHYAVALKYEPGQDHAPKVLAKGRNLIALRIIDIAQGNGVPIRTDPPLARQLYRAVKVGRTVPEELFQAVAKVIAWVYSKTKAKGPRTSATSSEAVNE
ncbi:MAG: flagellar biosynthesis protein FlhB [Planctomycetes bacterium]|nr:flagellar biosynthesis protein FlhB [Planctomycetota bacterium]